MSRKKPSWRKYILVAVFLALLITASLVYIYFTREQVPDPASENIIRQAAAKQLKKDPNELTELDFAKVIGLYLTGKKLKDIYFLEKFPHLEALYMEAVYLPEKDIPKWMKILARMGIYDLSKRFVLDLSPLAKLSNIQSLVISWNWINDIEPLSELVNLKELNLSKTMVSDLEPTKNLTNLQELYLHETNISNLEPIKNLKNLKILDIRNCINITDEQVEDLQKALPELKIYR
jgi:Leucine-rich repeat (LRR) protein